MIWDEGVMSFTEDVAPRSGLGPTSAFCGEDDNLPLTLLVLLTLTRNFC